MGQENSAFKSGLDVKSSVVKLIKINTTKAFKNLGTLEKPGCKIQNAVESCNQNRGSSLHPYLVSHLRVVL